MSEISEPSAVDRVLVMGVSGSGKTTVGSLLARRLGLSFVDGDALHPQANVEKMAAGIPLDDDDRRPWLEAVGRTLAEASHPGIVVACSALKRAYRDALRAHAPDTRFVHLDGHRDVLLARMSGRAEHFMPVSLLDSQLATLEPLGADEPGVVVDIDRSAEQMVHEAADWIRRGRRS